MALDLYALMSSLVKNCLRLLRQKQGDLLVAEEANLKTRYPTALPGSHTIRHATLLPDLACHTAQPHPQTTY
ncbi:hypothetical protein predicted by Glimmer/Critica [Acetobacter senegalensis]|uniref:Uncharacterized protein n=1 Tax=Acetobacter senegalensis TaxID=446692 RepID=A0A0U5ES15_9PROT|nr:hypothetical protein predicted by Glimmer/Critica [Acetobacter senegalensis]